MKERNPLDQRCPTDMILSPQLRNTSIKNCNLKEFLTISQLLEKVPVATFKELVATCGKWRQAWTTLLKMLALKIKKVHSVLKDPNPSPKLMI